VQGGKRECGQVGVKAAFDAGAQNLYGDGARAGRGCHGGPVHLRNRGGGNRRAEACENRPDRLVEGRRDRRLGVGLGEWRHAILQTLEVARQHGTDHVGPGRKKLPELDIARAELGQRRREARFRRPGRVPLQ
jgi:hypothetical protein